MVEFADRRRASFRSERVICLYWAFREPLVPVTNSGRDKYQDNRKHAVYCVLEGVPGFMFLRVNGPLFSHIIADQEAGAQFQASPIIPNDDIMARSPSPTFHDFRSQEEMDEAHHHSPDRRHNDSSGIIKQVI